MMKRYFTLLQALLVAAMSIAQATNDTINRMVLVESTYNPIIAGAVKRNFIPEEVKPTMSKEQVVYADENVDLTNFSRKAKPAQVTDITPEKGTPGYAHIGYGNYNNLSGLAAYKFRFDEYGDLAVKAHAHGWNGKFKFNDNMKWRSHLYDIGAEADYNILLGAISLNAGMHVAHYNYNYLTDSVPNGGTDTQRANNLGIYVGIEGSALDRYCYQAAIHYTHFGRSALFAEKTAHGEGHFRSEASLGIDLYEWGMATLLLRSDVLTYRGLAGYRNYHSLGITPRWDYRYGDFRFVGGLNMDFLAGKHIGHPLQVSPECSISYVPDKPFTVEFTLDGGRDINTFGCLHALSPYWATERQVLPTYTFLNARLSGSLRIIEGLHLHLGGGYKTLSNALFETVMDSVGTTYTGIVGHNAQVSTIDAAISYSHKELVSISAKSTYRHWTLRSDPALLARAPKFDADIDARVRIMPHLHAYTNLKLVTFTGKSERPIIDWSLGAHYKLNKRLTLFLDGHNLLNHRHQYYTGYPAQGFNVLMGAIAKF